MCTHGTLYCPVCEEKLERAVFSNHLEKCRVSHSTTPNIFDSFECSWCNEKMSTAYKADHDIVCLDKTHDCPMKQFGCTVWPLFACFSSSNAFSLGRSEAKGLL